MHAIAKGLIVDAAGTTVLNVATYADLVIRARAASDLPAKSAKQIADDANVGLGSAEQIGPRTQGLGALMESQSGLVLSDILPHLAYEIIGAVAYELIV